MDFTGRIFHVVKRVFLLVCGMLHHLVNTSLKEHSIVIRIPVRDFRQPSLFILDVGIHVNVEKAIAVAAASNFGHHVDHEEEDKQSRQTDEPCATPRRT